MKPSAEDIAKYEGFDVMTLTSIKTPNAVAGMTLNHYQYYNGIGDDVLYAAPPKDGRVNWSLVMWGEYYYIGRTYSWLDETVIRCY